MTISTQLLDDIESELAAKGWSRYDLAAAMRLHPQRLDAMLDDIEDWTVETLAKVCVVLGVKPSLRFADPPPVSTQYRFTIPTSGVIA